MSQSASGQSAVQTLRSMSANQGHYSNQIAAEAPALPYTEVCFDGSGWLSDSHPGGESPVGGQCSPGDIGWMIEHQERGPRTWSEAKAACLRDGMRLPEPFEFKVSCQNALSFGLAEMANNDEVVSNTAHYVWTGVHLALAVPRLGDGSCSRGKPVIIGDEGGGESLTDFRCVR